MHEIYYHFVVLTHIYQGFIQDIGSGPGGGGRGRKLGLRSLLAQFQLIILVHLCLMSMPDVSYDHL